MIKVRRSIFETNSSTSHNVTVYYGNTSIFSTRIYDDDDSDEEFELDESDIDKLLSALPIEKLRKELEKREND